MVKRICIRIRIFVAYKENAVMESVNASSDG